MRVLEAGSLARAALAISAGRMERVEGFGASPWWRACGLDGQAGLIWVGVAERATVRHPRTLLLADAPGEDDRRLVAEPLPEASPEPQARAGSLSRSLLRERAGVLRAGLDVPLGWPTDALGALLRARATAFVAALARDDWNAALERGKALLGAGPGFTPSGDDWLGGALVALKISTPGSGSAPLNLLAARLLGAAAERTHDISAALLGDCIALRGYAPLMALAAAAAEGDAAAMRREARALARLGHSSGRDLLRGFTDIALELTELATQEATA